MPFIMEDQAQSLYGDSWLIRVSLEPSKMCVSMTSYYYPEVGVGLREISGFNDYNGIRTFYNLLYVNATKPEPEFPIFKLSVTCNELNLFNMNIPLDERFIQLEQVDTLDCRRDYDLIFFKEEIKLNPLSNLMEDDQWHDFEMIVKPTQEKRIASVQVNKSILAANSPVFRSMLSGNWKESAQGYVELPTKLSTLEAFKKFVYTGHVPKDIEEIKNLLSFGNTYMVLNLEDACADPILDCTNLSNVFEMLDFTMKSNCKNLSKQLICKTKPQSIDIRVNPHEEPGQWAAYWNGANPADPWNL